MAEVPAAPGREQQRVVLHVGLPKTGTTWLQGLLAEQRDRLREHGVLYPFLRPGAMFHGAVEVRGSHEKFGLTREQVAGTWSALCERAREFPGTTLISHEVLAGATPREVRAALAPLAGVDVHVVVTARDLGRQATAHWQEEVKLGAAWSFAEFEAVELRADTGRDDGPDAGGVRPRFWHAQDHADALHRWAAEVGAARAHLVVCPAPGAAPSLLWTRFADACGIAEDAVDPTRAAGRNASLGGPEIALLRGVNAALERQQRPGPPLTTAARHRVVKREYAEGELAARTSPRPVCPAGVADVLRAATVAWRAEVLAAGYPVHGDLADLEPVVGDPTNPSTDPSPDVDPPPGEDAGAVAARLLARAREVDRARAPTSAPAAAPASTPRGLAARLRSRLRGPGRA